MGRNYRPFSTHARCTDTDFARPLGADTEADLDVESLFDTRLAIVREAPLEDGKWRELHRGFFDDGATAADSR